MSRLPEVLPEVLQADWSWTGRRFEQDVQIQVGNDGSIRAVGALGLTPDRRLPGSALLPGMVNAHSHAFQRGLRGHGETYTVSRATASADFWSWRRAMYGLVEDLDATAFRALTTKAFAEMRRAGITTVGEFHYFHHARNADFALDELVLDAAREAGIRLVLLEAFYKSGGAERPLEGAQRRFSTPSIEGYWRQMDRLATALDPSLQSLGSVAHSFRAATPEEISALYREARRRRLVFHLHTEEQPREIEETVAAYGMGPLALLCSRLDSLCGLTAVHCTHSSSTDLARFASRGGAVCICPTTEANLGDGIPDLPAMLGVGAPLCLGTDSNLRISMTEEMRWLEHAQRLRLGKRGVAVRSETDSESDPKTRAKTGAELDSAAVARTLFEAATEGGAASLGLEVGRIAPGRPADFLELDLGHPQLDGWTPDTLLASFIFGGADEAIRSTSVGGHWREHREANRGS